MQIEISTETQDETAARMCRGKTKHETKTRADRATRRMKGLVSFHCRYCHGWHVGNHLDH